MVQGVNNTGKTGDILDQFRQSNSDVNEARDKASMNKDEFLLLLTEQLKAQNPLNPSDNKEFAAQLAQFTQLEQTIEMRDALQEQVQISTMLTQSITNLTSAGLIGKSVKANNNQLSYNGENPVRFGFELPSNAESVTVEITDKSGNIVRTMQVSGKQGENTFDWDGKREDGTYVTPGTYKFSVVAKGAGDTTIRATPYSYGRVESIRFGPSGASVIIGGVAIPVSDITDISESATESGNDSEQDNGTEEA